MIRIVRNDRHCFEAEITEERSTGWLHFTRDSKAEGGTVHLVASIVPVRIPSEIASKLAAWLAEE